MQHKVQRALVSVSDKTGIEDFAKSLVELGVELLSTGGTHRKLVEAGIPVTEVSAYTGFPEMMDGRVKTLHPKVHGGILALRDEASHTGAMADHGIDGIDLVVVNLYPFEATIAKEGVTRAEAIEQIDIGGPSMVRSAAKNHRDVTVVCDPADYDRLVEEMAATDGATTDAFRARCARGTPGALECFGPRPSYSVGRSRRRARPARQCARSRRWAARSARAPADATARAARARPGAWRRR